MLAQQPQQNQRSAGRHRVEQLRRSVSAASSSSCSSDSNTTSLDLSQELWSLDLGEALNEYILHKVLVDDVTALILAFSCPNDLYNVSRTHKRAFGFVFGSDLGHAILNQAHQPIPVLHPLRRYMWQRRDTSTLPLTPSCWQLQQQLQSLALPAPSATASSTTASPQEQQQHNSPFLRTATSLADGYTPKRTMSRRSTRYTDMLLLFPNDPDGPVLINGSYDGVQIAPSMSGFLDAGGGKGRQQHQQPFLTLRQAHVRAMAAFPSRSEDTVMILLGTVFGQVILYSVQKVPVCSSDEEDEEEESSRQQQLQDSASLRSDSSSVASVGLECRMLSMVHHGRGEVLSFVLLPNKHHLLDDSSSDEEPDHRPAPRHRSTLLPYRPAYGSVASVSADNVIRVYPNIMDYQSLETHVVLPYCTGQQQGGRGMHSPTRIGTAFANPWFRQETFLAICAQQEVVVLRHTGEHIWQLCGGVLQQHGWSDNPTFWYDRRKNRLVLIVASRRAAAARRPLFGTGPMSTSTIQLWDIPETRNVFNRTQPIVEFTIDTGRSYRAQEQRGGDVIRRLLVIGNVLLAVTAASLHAYDLSTLSPLGIPKRIHPTPKVGVTDVMYCPKRESVVFLLDDDSVREWKPHRYYEKQHG